MVDYQLPSMPMLVSKFNLPNYLVIDKKNALSFQISVGTLNSVGMGIFQMVNKHRQLGNLINVDMRNFS